MRTSSSSARSRCVSPLTVACVPTGMKTGVWMSPCEVCSTPARAPVSRHSATSSNVATSSKVGQRPPAVHLAAIHPARLTITSARRALYIECLGMRGTTRRRRAQTQLIHGAPDMLLLKVVALGPIRGYPICQRIQQVSTDVLQLYRMEQKKWLSAEWRETEGGREAKFYALPRQRWKQLEVEA